MKAVCFHSYGGPQVLKCEEVSTPIPSSDEILIQVRSTGVGPFDAHVREGWYKDTSNYPIPCILGWEISGTVAEIGTQVSLFKKGDLVVAHPSVYRSGGGYAEYVTVKESEVAMKPKDASFAEAAAASMNGLVAWQALFDVAHVSRSQRVLVHAAAGGVGHLAVQLAKWKGAYVIGTASAANKEFLLSLGVDEVIDYRKTAFESVLSNIDIVIDTVGKEVLLKSFPIVKKSGIVVSIVDFENIKKATSYGIRGEAIVVEPNSQKLSEIMKLIEKKQLHVHISHRFSLDQACKAHELIDSGHVRGKIVLELR